ncbi:hypothetical protein V8F20_000462 [Naviculisporaceae sp. PSN 640]
MQIHLFLTLACIFMIHTVHTQNTPSAPVADGSHTSPFHTFTQALIDSRKTFLKDFLELVLFVWRMPRYRYSHKSMALGLSRTGMQPHLRSPDFLEICNVPF